MENSSKALIIAGAILVAILLVSVGIVIFNSVSEPLAQVEEEADSQDAQLFNAKFIEYGGASKSANNVKSLLGVVISANGTNKSKINVKLTVKNNNNTTTLYSLDDVSEDEINSYTSSMKTKIYDSSKYNVSFDYSNNGYINAINITEL